MHHDLTGDEVKRLAAFAFGFALGLVLIALVSALVEEWVIASDQADRQRIRDLVREELAKQQSPPPKIAELAGELDHRDQWAAAAEVLGARPATPAAEHDAELDGAEVHA